MKHTDRHAGLLAAARLRQNVFSGL